MYNYMLVMAASVGDQKKTHFISIICLYIHLCLMIIKKIEVFLLNTIKCPA